MEYNVNYGPVRWQISTSIKVILSIFCLLSPFSRHSQFKIRDLENVGQGHGVQHSHWRRSIAYTKLSNDFLYSLLSLSLSLFTRYSQIKKNSTVDIGGEDQGQEVEERILCQSTGNVRIHICMFQTFSYLATYVYA